MTGRFLRTALRAGAVAMLGAALGGLAAAPAYAATPAAQPASVKPARPAQPAAALASQECNGTAIGFGSFPFLPNATNPDDKVVFSQQNGVLPVDLIEVVLVADPGIDWFKAVEACRNDGSLIDRAQVKNDVDRDSMILRLADVNRLTFVKAGFLGIHVDKYFLDRTDLAGRGGSRITFTWQDDNL